MRNKLFFIILGLSPMVMAYGNNRDDVKVERIYSNTKVAEIDEAETPIQGAYGAYGAENDAENTSNSPQINIYNANSNKNKHKQLQEQDQDQVQDQGQNQRAVVDFDSENRVGDEYIQRANGLRRARKGMEVGTEQTMIQKIEFSRMEDERDRADRLFGNRLEKRHYNNQNGYNNENNYGHGNKTEKVIIVEKKENNYDRKHHNGYDDNNYTSDEYEGYSGWWGREAYVAPIFGYSQYGSAVNTRPGSTIGVALGSRYNSGLSFEGNFVYSTYELDDYNSSVLDYNGGQYAVLRDVEQYNFLAAAKYHLGFGWGRFSPYVTGLMSYTHRQYSGPVGNRFGFNSFDDSSSSNAVDAGVGVGADFAFTRRFSVGVDYRYMINAYYQRDESQRIQQRFSRNSYTQRKPLEEINYSMFLINGKFTF